MSEAIIGHRAEPVDIDFDRPALDRAAHELGVRLILLHGSRATGSAGPDSDLDIAVLGCPAESFLKCYSALGKVFSRYEMDMLSLERIDPLTRYEVLRDAVLLFGDPDLFCEYRTFAWRDFMDSADLRALEETLSRRKMARIKEQLHDSP